MSKEPLTQLLQDWQSGDELALEKLTPVVYEELKILARSAFRGERTGHTLQPTALVNEAYVKLIGTTVDWKDRSHFFALAARMMRRILVNHAVARQAEKRGSGKTADTFIDDRYGDESQESQVLLLTLDEQIKKLSELDERSANAVELHYFGGLTYQEMSEALDVSTSTVERDMKFAKAWLRKNLKDLTPNV